MPSSKEGAMNADGTMEVDDVVEIKERLARIEVLLSEKVGNLERRVAQLESNQKWVVRMVVGAVVLTVLAFIGLKV